MDTAETPSTGALDLNQAAALFGGGDEPEQEQATEAAKPVTEATAEAPADAAVDADAPEVEDADPDAPETFTIKVDGKDVQVTASEMAEHYKNGLRQADYTKKTMEAAEQRKAADAEATKAREERQKYEQGLQQAQAMLQAQLQEQQQIDWQKLLDTDPVEYLKQQHLANARQARLNQIHGERQELHAKSQAEQAEQMSAFIRTQQQELLAKLPEWKDESKAKAEKAQIKEYLQSQGFDEAALSNISDHRAVLLSRKAMLYDQMMSKAQAAAKKVSTLPQKVERPGGGETNPLDGRTTAIKQLSKSGSIRDAAAVFDRIFK